MVRKHITIWCLVLVSMIGLMPARARSAAVVTGPQQYWQKGLEYAENKLYIDAVEYFSRAIRTNKGEIAIADVAKIFNSRGLAYLAMNETDKALDDFSNAMELDDKNPEFVLNRGNLYAGGKEWEKARQDYSAVIKLNPRSAEAYAGRAKAFLAERELDPAIADFAKLLEVEPRNIGAFYGMGLAFRGKGQNEKAIEAFNEALKIDPRYFAASYQNAAIFARAGKIDAACIWLEEAVTNGFRDRVALENDPDFASLHKIDCYRKALARP